MRTGGRCQVAGASWLALFFLVPGLQAEDPQSASDTLFGWSVLKPATRPLTPALPPAPATRPAIGKDFWALVAVQSAATVWDIELTQLRMRQDPARRELNPFLPRRPGRGRMYAQFFAGNVAADYLAWRLRRAGHPNWARVVQLGSLALYGWGIQQNARHGRR